MLSDNQPLLIKVMVGGVSIMVAILINKASGNPTYPGFLGSFFSLILLPALPAGLISIPILIFEKVKKLDDKAYAENTFYIIYCLLWLFFVFTSLLGGGA